MEVVIISAIKEMRLAHGISQFELANIMNVTQGSVSQWEQGITRPNIGTLKKLAAYFGCTIDELLTDETERRA